MFKKPVDQPGLDEAITEALRELKGHEAHTKEYEAICDQLTKLYEIRDKKSDTISKDTLVTAAASLASVLVIVGYEHKHVIVSKALPFVKFK